MTEGHQGHDPSCAAHRARLETDEDAQAHVELPPARVRQPDEAWFQAVQQPAAGGSDRDLLTAASDGRFGISPEQMDVEREQMHAGCCQASDAQFLGWDNAKVESPSGLRQATATYNSSWTACPDMAQLYDDAAYLEYAYAALFGTDEQAALVQGMAALRKQAAAAMAAAQLSLPVSPPSGLAGKVARCR